MWPTDLRCTLQVQHELEIMAWPGREWVRQACSAAGEQVRRACSGVASRLTSEPTLKAGQRGGFAGVRRAHRRRWPVRPLHGVWAHARPRLQRAVPGRERGEHRSGHCCQAPPFHRPPSTPGSHLPVPFLYTQTDAGRPGGPLGDVRAHGDAAHAQAPDGPGPGHALAHLPVLLRGALWRRRLGQPGQDPAPPVDGVPAVVPAGAGHPRAQRRARGPARAARGGQHRRRWAHAVQGARHAHALGQAGGAARTQGERRTAARLARPDLACG